MGKFVIGVLVTGMTLLVLAVGALTAGGLWLRNEINKALVPADTFGAIKVGDGRAQVLGKLPKDGASPDLAGQAPAAPKGTSCEYYFVKGGESREGMPEPTHAYQLCFKGDALVAKQRFPVRKGSFV